jgi:DNA helicase-2/ATP-dependent DNA helicase PcrA
MGVSRKQVLEAGPAAPRRLDESVEAAQTEAEDRVPLSQRAMATMVPPYFAGLNPEQREAVEALDGPVLVLAGAGTGKTRVLTTRIAHILATRRAFPSQILAVTFTNKAAREMKLRIGQLVGGAVEGMPWLGTFHSIGARICAITPSLSACSPPSPCSTPTISCGCSSRSSRPISSM